MKANLLVGALAVMLAASVASAREVPPPDPRTDTRASVIEQLDGERPIAEELTCSTGHPAGWFAAIAGLGLLAGRRSRR